MIRITMTSKTKVILCIENGQASFQTHHQGMPLKIEKQLGMIQKNPNVKIAKTQALSPT